MTELTKDEAVVCIMIALMVLVAVAIVMGALDGAATGLPATPSFFRDMLGVVARLFRGLSLMALVAGLIGTLVLPSRPEGPA
jgi:hypothetical protein